MKAPAQTPLFLLLSLLSGACHDRGKKDSPPASTEPPEVLSVELVGDLSGDPGLIVEVRFVTDDPDSVALSDVFAVPLFPGANEISVALDVPEEDGLEQMVLWDTTGAAEGLWTVEVRARDEESTASRTAASTVQLGDPQSDFPALVTEGGGGSPQASALGTAQLGGAFAAGWMLAGGEPCVFAAGEAGETVLTPTPGYHDLFLARYAPDGSLQWIERSEGIVPSFPEGDSQSLEMLPHAVSEAGFLDARVAGHFSGVVVLGAGDPNETVLANPSSESYGFFLASWDALGELEWAFQASGLSDVHFEHGRIDAVALADGRTVVSGGRIGPEGIELGGTLLDSLENGGFLAAFDDLGAAVWAQGLPRKVGATSAGHPSAVDVRSDGGILVVGAFFDEVGFGPRADILLHSTGSYGLDLFVAAFAADGSVLWVRQAGGVMADTVGTGIVVLPDGSFVVTGEREGDSITFDAGLASEITLGPAAEDGSVFLAGYAADGTVLWARDVGLTLDQNAWFERDVAALPDGSVALLTGIDNPEAGSTVVLGDGGPDAIPLFIEGERALVLSRWSAAGGLLWALDDGGPEGDVQAKRLARLAGGALAALGQASSSSLFGFGTPGELAVPEGDSLFLATWDEDGNF